MAKVSSDDERDGVVIPDSVSANIQVIDGEDRGRVKRLRAKRLVMGRKSGDLLLSDPKISGSHAAIEYDEGRFTLYDLNSTNGTFVNEEQIREKELNDRDKIRLGFTTLEFRLQETPAAIESGARRRRQSNEVDALEESDIVSHATQIARHDFGLTFEVRSGPHKGEAFQIRGENIVIGRINTDICLNDRDVSRKHAVVEIVAPDQIFVRDLASSNGTYINGGRISNGRLRSGDILRVGGTDMRVMIEKKS